MGVKCFNDFCEGEPCPSEDHGVDFGERVDFPDPVPPFDDSDGSVVVFAERLASDILWIFQ